MKYRLLSFLSILTVTFCLKTSAQADSIVPRWQSLSARESNHQNLDSPALISPPKSSLRPVTSPKPNQIAIGLQSGSSMTIAALERSIHRQIDQYRQSLNLPPLVIDPTVSAQARAHSRKMAASGTLSHTMESVDLQRKYPTAAENIASSKDNSTPDLLAVQDWIASPAHHQHILGNYNLTGIGVAKNTQGEYFFTQIFVNKK